MAIKTPTFRKSVGSIAMEATYNTIVFDYYPMISVADRPIFWDARYCQEWASGKVAYEHNKLLSSGIGSSVIKILDNRILGSNLIYKKGRDTDDAKATVDFIRNKCRHLKFDQVTQSVNLKRLGGGSSYFVLNPIKRGGEKDLLLDALGIDQAYVTFKGSQIERAKIFINFVDDNGGITSMTSGRYFLIEERYFKDGKPYSSNRIYKSIIPQMEGAYSTFNSTWRDDKTNTAEDITDAYIDGTAQISESVLKIIKESGLTFGYEFPLPFKGLGIAHCKCSSSSLKHPNSKYGDPVLINCYDLLWSYDFAFSILTKDLYVGRPMTFIPDTLNGNKLAEQSMGDSEWAQAYYNRDIPNAALFDDEFVKVPNYKMEYQTPTSIQYDIRSEEIKTDMDNLATMVAHNVGIEPQTLISELTQTNETKTAFEVANDTSIPNTSTLRRRALMQDAINEIVDEMCYYYGKDAEDVIVCFPPLDELNMTLTADYIVKLRSVNGMSDETLVDLAYKDKTEAEKQEEIDRIKQLKEEEKEEIIKKWSDGNSEEEEDEEETEGTTRVKTKQDLRNPERALKASIKG